MSAPRLRYLLAALVIAAYPALAPNSFFIHIGQTFAYTAIAVIGLNLLLGLSGQMSLGQAGFYALGAYGSALASTRLGWPLWLAMPFGMLVAGAAGGLVGLVALRTRGLYLAMATLAFGFIVEILAQRWVGLTGGTMGLFGVPQLDFGDMRTGQTTFFWFAAGALLLVQVLSDYAFSSRWGRYLRAIKESESFAQTIGLDVPVWRTGVFRPERPARRLRWGPVRAPERLHVERRLLDPPQHRAPHRRRDRGARREHRAAGRHPLPRRDRRGRRRLPPDRPDPLRERPPHRAPPCPGGRRRHRAPPRRLDQAGRSVSADATTRHRTGVLALETRGRRPSAGRGRQELCRGGGRA